MSESLISTIISAVIAGVFRLISKQMEINASKTKDTPSTQSNVVEINKSTALNHIGIIQLLVNLSGFFLIMIIGQSFAFIAAQAVIGTIVAIVSFRWSALQVEKIVRWKHLVVVAVGVGITTLIVNSILFGTISLLFNLGAYAIAFAQSFISMGIGGYLADKSEA